jgi:hypothetical protein
MNIHIELGKVLKDGTTKPRIYLYDGSGNPVRINIPVSLRPTEWDKKKRRVKFAAPLYLLKNAEIERYLERAERLSLLHPMASPATLKALMEQHTAPGGSMLSDMVARWVEGGKASTAKQYKSFATMLLRRGCDVDMAQATDADMVRVLGALSKGLAPNTAWSRQKLLNKAIREANKAGRSLATLHAAKLRTATGKEVLSWGELAVLLMYRPLSPSEADYKTIAVGMALTGCRIGDLWQMLGSIQERDGVRCALFKCNKPPHREVSPIVFAPFGECLEKYGIPWQRAEQKVRVGVQGVVRAAGIAKHIELHSLRRSFITNFLSLGVVPEHLLAKVFTGHSMGGELRIFHGYDRATFGTHQRTVMQLLRIVEEARTGGVRLL